MDENTINQRLKVLQKAKTKTVKAFAAAISMPQTTVNNYFKYNTEPSLATIISILTTFPDISPDWLLLGQGSMYRKHNSVSNDVTVTNSNISQRGHNNFTGSNNVVNEHPQTDNKDAIIQQLLEQNQKLIDKITQ